MSSLTGKTIVVTRASESNAHLASLLERRGACVLSVPMIEIANPDSWLDCDNAIVSLAGYDGVIFTSQNAVEMFLGRIGAISPTALTVLRRSRTYAVGKKTAAVLESAGVGIKAFPESSSAEELAALIACDDIKGKRFLLPKSDIARDVLPAALRSSGATVDEVVVYKTVAPSESAAPEFRTKLMAGTVDAITFFSPSAVRNFVRLFGTEQLRRVIVAVIGATTSAAAKDVGVHAAVVASNATAESLVRELEEFFRTHQL